MTLHYHQDDDGAVIMIIMRPYMNAAGQEIPSPVVENQIWQSANSDTGQNNEMRDEGMREGEAENRQ
jgi:hypothetical protein